MKRVDANTFVMDWGDKTSAAAPAPASPTAPTSQPPIPGPATHVPSGQGAPPASVPPPVMPVQRDIIIKF